MWSEIPAPGKIKYIERYTDPLSLKQRRVSITLNGRDTAANRKVAQAELAQKIAAASPASISQEHITLDMLLSAYTAHQEKTVKMSTCTHNHGVLSRLNKLFGGDSIVDNLTAQYVKETLISAGYEPRTMNEYIRRFKAMINWGYENDFCNNSELVHKLKYFKDATRREKVKDKFMEPEELKKLLGHMYDTGMLQWYYLTLFLSLTGLRIGEAIALEVSDVDGDYIHVAKNYDLANDIITTPKTSTSIRDVFIQSELRLMLKEYRDWSRLYQIQTGIRSTHLFYHPSGGYVSYGAYNKYLREASEAVLGRKVSPHTLRHTHASMLMANRVDIDTISRRLGHESSQITREIYLHVMNKLVESDNEQIKEVNIL